MELPSGSSTLAGVSDEVTLSWKKNLLIVGAVAAVSIWYFGAQGVRQREKEDKAPPDVMATVAIGDAVLLHEVVHVDAPDDWNGTAYRLSLNVPGGATRAKVRIDEPRACGPAPGAKIWCVSKRGVELRDGKTLAVVANEDAFEVAMRARLGEQQPQLDLTTGELHVQTAGGTHLALDAAGPRARPAPEGDPSRPFGLDYRNPRSLSKEEYREGFAK